MAQIVFRSSTFKGSMKTLTSIRFLTSLLAVNAGVLWGAPIAANPSGATLPAPTPYAVVSRDAHSRVWERTVYERGPSGQAIASKHRYVELATGLNFWDSTAKQWQESQELIETFPGGAIARQGQHQVIFANNLATVGAIDMQTPDGKRMRSHVLGLSYFDTASGQSVLIAEVKDSQGQLYPPNVVIYPDAFTDFKADVRYTYTRAGFEQDIILHERPPGPEAYGLNPATTRLQVLTEFLNPPQPGKKQEALKTRQGDALDEDLDFGVMKMGQGKAFSLERGGEDIRVSKQWLKLEGRDFLVEEVAVPDLDEELQALPAAEGASLNPAAGSVRHVISKQRRVPTMPLVQVGTNEMQLARLSLPSQGLVLDYTTLNSGQSSYTFQGDTTYYISGTVNLSGTNTFEGGTVIKYAANASINLLSTALNWGTAAYRPVVFTAKDDDTVGESITGSTGNPTGYYAKPALSFASGSTLKLTNCRVAFANQALSAPNATLTLFDSQVVNCQQGLTFNSTLYLRNVLFSKVKTNLNYTAAGNVYLQNCTFDTSVYLMTIATGSSGFTMTATNCILANVTNLYGWHPASYTFTGSSNGFYMSPVFGTGNVTNTFYPFQAIGAGSHYLANGCNFFNAGTTNIDSTLLADLRTKTTYPPVVYSNVTISAATNLSPQAQRDTDTPDLGYHYDPLDYCFGGVLASSNLTFTAGTAVGWFYNWSDNGYGISLGDGVTVAFNGVVTNPCVFARYNTVQEGNGNWTPRGWLAGITGQSYVNTAPVILASFTRCAMLNSEGNVFRDYNYFLRINAVNCEFWTGIIDGYYASENFTNCLFFRSGTGLWTDNEAASLSVHNCTFIGGSLIADHTSGSSWPLTVVNSAFDRTTISMWDVPGNSTNAYCDYNAFLTNANRTLVMGGHEVTNLISYNWQSSWLGNYYLPANSPLINRGNPTANQVGLYHFTTQTNQVKETNSIVDIAYHYVAVGTNGIPIDSNSDGIPDYLEDANGNGLVDPGETAWMPPPAITVQPASQTVNQNSNASFVVTATSLVPMSYQWLFNGTNLVWATNATLTIPSAQPSNGGVYRVMVSNAAGSVDSAPVTLAVESGIRYYVATTGSDTNSGTNLNQPFKTIQKAFNTVVAGGSIYIRGGTYREFVVSTNHGSPTNRIIVSALSNEVVVLKGSYVVTGGWVRVGGYTNIWRANWTWTNNSQQVFVHNSTNFAVTDEGYPLQQVGMPNEYYTLSTNTYCTNNYVNTNHLWYTGMYAPPNQNTATTVTDVLMSTDCTFVTNGCVVLTSVAQALAYMSANPGTFFNGGFSNNQYVGTNLYVRLKDDSNPNNHGIEASVSPFVYPSIVVYWGADGYFHLKNLHFRHSNSTAKGVFGSAVDLNNGCIYENCDVQWTDFGAFGAANSQVINCIMSNIGNNGTSGLYLYGCTITNNNYRNFNTEWHAGGVKYIAPYFDPITIEHCNVSGNNGVGIWFDGCTSGNLITIRNNYIANNQRGIHLEVSTNILIYNNLIVSNYEGITIRAACGVKMYNNIIAYSQGFPPSDLADGGLGAPAISIYGIKNTNTFLFNNEVINNIIWNSACTYDMSIPTNNWSFTNWGPPVILISNNICNYNCIYSTNRNTGPVALCWSGSATFTNLSDWTKATGYDSNSVSCNPQFVNGPGGDFHLQLGSPLIDRGQSLPLVPFDYQYTSRPQGTNYDIGAFER
jgi:hypothetical protein